ncbi:MAG: exo-alpha-sialidase [Pirellula sp.]|jgi:predicted neuraminidase|nr:exo-alpha-sialidase [Pirellula sp.]
MNHHPIALVLGCVLSVSTAIAQEAPSSPAIQVREFIYEQASFPSCHASTIADCNGTMVAAWFGGTHEKHPDVGIWVSRRVNGTWTPPTEVANGVISATERYPTWNPVLFQPRPRAGESAPVVLFYKVGPSPETWWGMVMTSSDGGISWSAPKRLPDGILGPIKNKPIELEDGTWLCPTSTETEEEPSKWQVHFEWTKDQGATWSRTPSLNDGVAIQAIQPSILRLDPKTLRAIGRTRQDRIFEIDSKDGGVTWTNMRLGSLPNNNSGIDAVTLASGLHVIVYNHVPGTPGEWGGKRTPLNMATSKDGINWLPSVVLENQPGEYSYPAIIESSDGRLHVTYTWNRKKIRYVVLDPAKL